MNKFNRNILSEYRREVRTMPNYHNRVSSYEVYMGRTHCPYCEQKLPKSFKKKREKLRRARISKTFKEKREKKLNG